jgi:hypothetical protein
MESKYKWAVNIVKLERAIRILGPSATEKQLLEEYRKYAGLVAEEYVPEFLEVVQPVAQQDAPEPAFVMPEVGQTVIVPQHIVDTLTKPKLGRPKTVTE